jgi:hypothetical protein
MQNSVLAAYPCQYPKRAGDNNKRIGTVDIAREKFENLGIWEFGFSAGRRAKLATC